jgi:hypothetical protein
MRALPDIPTIMKVVPYRAANGSNADQAFVM